MECPVCGYEIDRDEVCDSCGYDPNGPDELEVDGSVPDLDGEDETDY